MFHLTTLLWLINNETKQATRQKQLKFLFYKISFTSNELIRLFNKSYSGNSGP